MIANEPRGLRNKLSSIGWAMVYVPGWGKRILSCADEYKSAFKLSVQNMAMYKRPVNRQNKTDIDRFALWTDFVLHALLPNESFHLGACDLRYPTTPHCWHQDGTYLRVILPCEGPGTIVALGDEEIKTPTDHMLILSGVERNMALKTVPATWHRSPDYSPERVILVVDFWLGASE